MLIAPLSANTLAKLANGLSDNLLVCMRTSEHLSMSYLIQSFLSFSSSILLLLLQTCIVRAWDFNNPLIVAPAMNTLMWDHPLTSRHLNELQQLGVHIIPPIAKTLACGDTGMTLCVCVCVCEREREREGGGMVQVLKCLHEGVPWALEDHREREREREREAYETVWALGVLSRSKCFPQ